MSVFTTSIRVPEGTQFGATINRGTLYISLDGPFTEGTIVLKMTVSDWVNLADTVYDRLEEGEK